MIDFESFCGFMLEPVVVYYDEMKGREGKTGKGSFVTEGGSCSEHRRSVFDTWC